MKKFTVTDKHIKLLRNAYVSWEDCELGAPSINCKRPYGNGDVVGDVIAILFGELPEEAIEGLHDYACQLHKETETALQIVLRTGEFKPGNYECEEYTTNWKEVQGYD